MNTRTRKLAPSFLKLLILPDFNRTIGVPPFFSRSYEDSLRDGKVTLRFGGTDKTWDVKVEIAEDGRYEFTRGWDLFAQDVGLRFGEIVVCRLVGDSTFHISTFGVDCTEWKAAPRKTCYDEEQDDTSMSEIQRDNIRKKGKAPVQDQQQVKSFTTVINNTHHKYCLNIPMAFAKVTGIMSGQIIKLQNERGETWRVLVSTRLKDGRMGLMTEDWTVFWEKNNLSNGTKLTFTFDSSKPDTLVVTKKRKKQTGFCKELKI